jgi:uncharacterized membrane protein YedE/YeeE
VSLIVAALTGALFGTGLIVAGMTQPSRIIGFLDVLSGWQPSLMFVMGGAVLVYAVAFRWVRGALRAPWLDSRFHVPARKDLDLPLVVGAAIFGIGWGLGGYCPGPALVSAASGSTSALTFVAAMLVGMYAHHRLAR